MFCDARTPLETNLINSQESEETILLIFVKGILVMENGKSQEPKDQTRSQFVSKKHAET